MLYTTASSWIASPIAEGRFDNNHVVEMHSSRTAFDQLA